MIVWLIVGPYVLVALVCVRLVAGHAAWSMFEKARPLRRQGPDGWEWSAATILGLLAGMVWPLVGVVLVAGRVLPSVGAEARHEAKVKDERIRELERQLEIR